MKELLSLAKMVPFVLLVLEVISWAESRSGSSDDKIVGGFLVKNISRSPYVVSIQIQNITNNGWRQQCAGCLLSALYVLTACHCVAEKRTPNDQIQLMTISFDQWFFIAGALNASRESWKSNPQAQHRNPIYIRYHPECKLRQNQWLSSDVTVKDASIAKMSKPFYLNVYVQPAALVTFYPNIYRQTVSKYYGRRCTVVGWGWTDPRSVVDDISIISTTTEQDEPVGPTSEPPYIGELLNLSLTVRNDEECWGKMADDIQEEAEDYADASIFPFDDFKRRLKENLKDQLCGLAKSESPCTGDWGSPLICEDRIIAGVTSWGVGCGNPVPTVVQSLAEVVKWVGKEICTFDSCEDVRLAHPLCERTDQFGNNCSITTTEPSTLLSLTTEPLRLQTHSNERQENSAEPLVSPDWLCQFIAFYRALKNLEI